MSGIAEREVERIAGRIVERVAALHGWNAVQLRSELEGADPALPVSPALLLDALGAIADDLGVELSATDPEVRASLYYVSDLARLAYERLCRPRRRRRRPRPLAATG